METNVAKHHRLTGKGARSLRRKLLPLLIAGCFGSALANPLGPQVVNGQASFSQQGNTLSVTNTPGAVINWNAFSIGSGEVTRFIQQSASSSVLNRVVGQDPSQILGALQSNGRVFLVNPNGILFGAGAQINVNGLVASTLNISDEDFLNGKMRFNAVGTVGNLKNEGTITTSDGGHVYLIAPNVENSGIITSPKGEVLLAAGHSVELVDSANPDLHVVLSAAGNEALNVGEIVTQGGRTGIFGDLVRHSGIINADSAVVGENGRIVFKASGDTLLENGSRTTATGAGTGGDIHILGNRVGLTGDAMVDASGQQGGGTVLVGGDYQGKNPDIRNATHTYLGKDTRINADATQNGDGGKVIIWADKSTAAYGKVSARGGAESGDGGFVETSGKEHLTYRGTTDVRAANGSTGTLLLDPTNIVIRGGSGDGDGSVDTTGFGTNVAGTIFDTDAGPSEVYESEIEAQSASANIILLAEDGISTAGTFDDGVVTLASGSSLSLRTRNASGDGTTGIDLTGSTHGTNLEFRTQGTGSILIEGGYDGTAGPVSVTVGRLRSEGGTITLRSNGDINVNNALVSNSMIELDGAGTISQTAAGILAGNALKVNGGNVLLDQADNPVGVIAGSASGDFRYRTANLLTVSAVDGSSGISAGGDIVLESLHPQGINQNMGNSITTGGGLALKTVGAVELQDANNSVTMLAADLNQEGSSFGFRNASSLQIGSVAGINGISTTNGNVKISVGGSDSMLTVGQLISAGTGEVDLIADNLTLGYAINSSMVSIQPFTGGRAMTIGASCGGDCLSVTNLFHINATTIGLGHEVDAGSIDVAGITVGGTAATDRNAATTRIGLITSGGITQSGSINVQQLGIEASGDVNLSLANSVADLAAETNGHNLNFRNAGSLRLETIDGADYGDDYLIDGISTANGDVTVTVDTGNIDVQAKIDAGASGNVTLFAANGSIGGGSKITGHYLDAVAANGMTLATAVDGLSANNTGANSDISIVNARPVTLYNVRQSGAGSTGNISITNTGALTIASDHAVAAQGGAISISTHSPLTVDGFVSTSSTIAGQGNIALSANSSAAPLTDNLTINGAVTANAGNITLMAGNNIIGAEKAVTASGVKTVIANMTSTQTQASNTIQTAIAPTATSTTTSTTVLLAELTGTDGTQESEETKDGESSTADTTADGAKENEPAQKLYCN